MSARRIDAVRHLLQPHHLKDSLAVGRQPSLRNAVLAGLQTVLAMAIALPSVHLSPWPHLIGYAALGALAALFGRFAPERGRNRILAQAALWLVLAVLTMSLIAWLGLPVLGQLALLALSCGLFFFVTASGRFGPPGALIFVFAAGAALHPVVSLQEVLERTAATAIVALLAWGICSVTEVFRHQASPERPFPADPQQPRRYRLIASARIALGAGIAIFASHAIGADHPAWAAMGTLAVMQGAHLHINMNRALQRMAGTLVGALLAALVLGQQPNIWGLMLLLIALQFATELCIGANYALGQIFVTPMALVASLLATPGLPGAAMAPERILDTLLGAGIGILVAVLLSTLDDRQHLAHFHLARTSD